MNTIPRRVRRNLSALVVVDIQERLLPAMHDAPGLLRNVARLIRGAETLGLPVLATEQYRKGLGPTVPEVAGCFAEFKPLEKMAFSACGAGGFGEALQARGPAEDILLCGIEAHVCVMQTCLDLLDGGRRVFAVADAVASRTQANRRTGIERMRDAGAVIVSTEMILFELLGTAGTEQFKAILNLVK